jgi:hypothetical protein
MLLTDKPVREALISLGGEKNTIRRNRFPYNHQARTKTPLKNHPKTKGSYPEVMTQEYTFDESHAYLCVNTKKPS